MRTSQLLVVLCCISFLSFGAATGLGAGNEEFLETLVQAMDQHSTSSAEPPTGSAVPATGPRSNRPSSSRQTMGKGAGPSFRQKVGRSVQRFAKQLLETFGMFVLFIGLSVLMLLSYAAFICFTLVATPRQRSHFADLTHLCEKRPWKSLALGLANILLALVVIRILFSPGLVLFGLLFLAWFIGKLLECLAARACKEGLQLYTGSDERFPYSVAIGAAVLWPTFLIPFYGQVSFLATIIRGLGAKSWIYLRGRNDGNTAEELPPATEDSTSNDDGTSNEDSSSSETVVIENATPAKNG